jgi:hypothetical protein
LSWFVDDDGYWVIRGRLPPESGAMVTQVLQQAMEEQFCELQDVPAGTADQKVEETRARPEPISWRRADALVRLAQGYRNHCGSGYAEKFLIHVHTDMETLKAEGAGAESEIDSDGIVCSETTRRIACDSAVVQWLDQHDGQPLSAGRKSRTVPAALRRALQRRDGGCRFPGCTASHFVDAHHIRHWADGGDTCMENLVLLCTRHHHLVHEGGFGLEKLSCGTIQFTNPQGVLIPDVGGGRSRGNVDNIFALNNERGICISPKSSQSCWMGEKMDDQLAVEGLLFRE